jgi:hypothetical protein
MLLLGRRRQALFSPQIAPPDWVVEINQIDDLGLVLEPLLNDLGYR